MRQGPLYYCEIQSKTARINDPITIGVQVPTSDILFRTWFDFDRNQVLVGSERHPQADCVVRGNVALDSTGGDQLRWGSQLNDLLLKVAALNVTDALLAVFAGLRDGAPSRGAALDAPIYFCDSSSPWQRGSNENMNGLLRDYFPKRTDLSIHSQEHLLAVENELNDRPRQVLNDHAPAELFAALLASKSRPRCDVEENCQSATARFSKGVATRNGSEVGTAV